MKQIDKADVKDIVITALKLPVICLITATLLACVNSLTADKIAENIRAEKTAAIASIFPSADKSELVDKQSENVDELYLVTDAADELLGYAAAVSPMGFGGELELMVGVNQDGSLAGVKLVSHSETPGLGSRVGSEEYLSQYVGKGGTLTLGRDVDAISGSTISSRAILDGVNSALAAYSELFTENDILTGGAR